MSTLADQHCEACRADAPRLSKEEIATLIVDLPDWQMEERDGEPLLCRHFKFGNFKDALTFANVVGELAEQNNHHPELTVGWGMTTVRWWTHKIKGLHHNDFIMAARTDRAFDGRD
jgi:4a-hydroxytetrahydrobiopterin dehydratase